MPGPRCSPPKTISVSGYFRTKPRRKRKPQLLPFVVRDTRTGSIVSQHRTSTAAVRMRKRLDLNAFRAGRGRPFETGKR